MSELGPAIGYCPTCFIEVGEMEIGQQCSRCNQLLFPENLLNERDVHIEKAKQSLPQAIGATPFPSSWAEYHKKGGNKY